MFQLDPEHWHGGRILDCPGGPGSLAAELWERGLDVTVVDPLNALNTDELEQRARADLEATARSSSLRPDFDLNACRREHFTSGRPLGPSADRYVAARPPICPSPTRALISCCAAICCSPMRPSAMES